jgi:hypothetical protein
MSLRSSALTATDVQQALSTLGDVDASSRQLAVKSLSRKGNNIEVTEDAVRLYLALRQLLGRVSPDLAREWQSKHLVRSCSRREFWVVPMTNMTAERRAAVLAVDQNAIVDASSIARIDPLIDLSANVIVDQIVERKMLGLGVYVTEVTTGTESVLARDPGSSMPALPDLHQIVAAPKPPTPALPDTTTSTTPMQAIEDAPDEGANVQPARTLEAKSSDESMSGLESDARVAREIASTTIACFEAQRFFSSDPHLPNFAEYWLQSYTSVVCQKYEMWLSTRGFAPQEAHATEFLKSLHPMLAKYPKYVLKSLMNSDALAALPHFVKHLAVLKEKLPALLPNVASAVIRLASFDLNSVTAMPVDDLSLGERQILFKSKLYKEFTTSRIRSKLQAVRAAHSLSDELRHQQVMALTDVVEDDEDKKDVAFARGLFSQMSRRDKVTFLLAGDNFQRMRQWSPDHELLVLQAFLSKDTRFSDIEGKNYDKAVDIFMAEGMCLQDVGNGTLQALLKEYRKAAECVGTDADLSAFVKACFLEFSSFKLGVSGWSAPAFNAEAVEKEAGKEMSKNISKVMGTNARRVTNAGEAPASALLLKACHDPPATTPLQSEGPTLPAGAKISASQAPAAPSASTSEESLQHPDQQSVDQASQSIDFQVGEVVKTSPSVKKIDQRNLRAEITAVLSQHYWIQFQEGVGGIKGTQLKIPKKNVIAATAPDTSSAAAAHPPPPLVPAAGTKRSMPEEDASQVQQRKRAADEAEADSLFGVV